MYAFKFLVRDANLAFCKAPNFFLKWGSLVIFNVKKNRLHKVINDLISLVYFQGLKFIFLKTNYAIDQKNVEAFEK